MSAGERLEALEQENRTLRQRVAGVDRVLERLPFGIFTLDQELRLVRANPAAVAMYGLDVAKNMSGSDIYATLTRESAEKKAARHRALLGSAGPAPALVEQEWLSDGSQRWVRISETRLSNDEGAVTGLVAVCLEDTRRVQVEQALARKENLLDEAERIAHLGMWEWDLLNDEMSWSDELFRIFGVLPGDFEPSLESFAQQLTPEDRKELHECLARLQQHEGGVTRQWRITRADRSEAVIRWRAQVHRAADGRAVRLLAAIQDVTAQQRVEEERQRHVSYLERLERIDRIISGSTDLERTLDEVISIVFEIFDADRAWLMYPCDPEAACFQVPVERTHPDFPGAHELRVEVPMTEESRDLFRKALASEGPVRYVAQEESSNTAISERFHIKSRLAMALRPTVGEAWLLGLHQCRYARVWTAEEKRLLQDIGNRLSNALSNLVLLRNLRASERQFRLLADHLPGVVYISHHDRHHSFIYVNEQIEQMTGYPRELFTEHEIYYAHLLHPDDERWIFDYMGAAVDQQQPYRLIYRVGNSRGEYRWVEEIGSAVQDERTGNTQFLLGFIHDITQRIDNEETRFRLEEQMQEAQKLESLGVLAGGVAHDFNNLLVGILGHAGLVREDLKQNHPAQESLSEIEASAQRAADLCRQMLAYSGRGRFSIEKVDLSNIISGMQGLLELSVEKEAILTFELGEGLPEIEADPNQMRQVVMNLVLNASEALLEGRGSINVRTWRETLDMDAIEAAHTAADETSPGEYVLLEVWDAGAGIDAQTREHIFEPFYSTKFTGRGLGLPAVLGIVRAHGGAIFLNTQPEKGASFRIALPARSPRAEKGGAARAWKGQGRILLVEDEQRVRSVCKRMLQHVGFKVLAAGPGVEAVARLREAGPFVCILLNINVDSLDGAETYRAVHAIAPETPLLVTSSCHEEELRRFLGGWYAKAFLRKPYQLDDMREVLRQLLDPQQ